MEKQRRKDEQAADRERDRVAKDEQRERDRTAKEEQRERERVEKEEQRERSRLEKEEQAKSNEDKPRKLSTFFSRGSSFGASKAATAATATATTAAATESTPADKEADASDDSRSDKDVEAEGSTFHDQATVPEGESANEATTVPSTDAKEEPAAAESPSVERTSSLENRSSIDEEKDGATSPTSPAKGRSRVKSWMRVRFRSKSGSQKDNEIMPAVTEQEGDEANAVKKEENKSEDAEAPAKDTSRPESMRDVAMAGRSSHESDDMYGPPRAVSPQGSKGSKGSRDKVSRDRSASISSLSSHYSEETKDAKSEEATIEEAKVVEIKPQASNEPSESEGDQRGRSGFKARLLRKITPNKTATKDDKAVTPVTSNATNEEFEEARDTFEEEKSSPPAPLSTVTGEGTEGNDTQKTISPKASRERSRFTEDL